MTMNYPFCFWKAQLDQKGKLATWCQAQVEYKTRFGYEYTTAPESKSVPESQVWSYFWDIVIW